MSNPDIQNREHAEFFRKKKEQEKKFPRFNALASKKHEVIFDNELGEAYVEFTNLLRKKYGNESVNSLMAHHAGMSTPKGEIFLWDFKGKDSIERFLYKIVLEKKSKKLLDSEFENQYLEEFFKFSKELSKKIEDVRHMEALDIAVGSPVAGEFEIFDTPDFEISTFVDQEYEKYFPNGENKNL